jgi:putative ABC transport system substrate-binding protein
MNRRQFIACLASTTACPVVTRAQQAAIPVIGFLDTSSSDAARGPRNAFVDALKEAGYVEGKNVAIEFRWANNRSGLSEMAADLVRRQVNVIVAAGGNDAVFAAKGATSSIPIVMIGGPDPVELGLAASLSRPGGNLTGVALLHNQFASKRLSLLLDLLPDTTKIGYLVGYRGAAADNGLTDAVSRLGRQVIELECRSTADFEAAFATLVEHQAGGLIVSAFPVAFNNRNTILALAARYKIPAIYSQSQYSYGGGLMSYTAFTDMRTVVTQYVTTLVSQRLLVDRR